MQVTVELPDQVARQWGETPDAVGRHVLEDAAIEGYRAGRLSQRQVGALLGAKLALFSLDEQDGSYSELRKNIRHISLNEDPGFHEIYVEQMQFPASVGS